jgi:putative methionine-R-sulfoxide reductase with GAF domain
MSNFLNTLKSPARVSIIATVFFFMGIMWSAYLLYTLQQEMIYSQAIHVLNTSLARAVFLKPAAVVIITFALGVFAINVSYRSKREVIVFVDKKKEDDHSQAILAERESETGDLGSLRNALQQAKGTSEIIQAGVNTICNQVEAGTGALYLVQKQEDKRFLELKQGFALSLGESQTIRFEFGEGLVGQAATSGKSVYIDEVPEGYIKVVSGLGTSSPRFLFIVVLKKEGDTFGVLELATFKPLNEATRKRVEEMGQILVDKIS